MESNLREEGGYYVKNKRRIATICWLKARDNFCNISGKAYLCFIQATLCHAILNKQCVKKLSFLFNC